MGFFKKKEISAEEQVRINAEKAEKERIRAEKTAEKEKQRTIDSATRAEKKEAKKAAEQAELEKFFGSDPGFYESSNFGIYNIAIERIRKSLLELNETVIATIPVECDISDKKEVKGVLVATDQKLIYSSNSAFKEFTEVMDYKSMTGISLAADGFLKKELHVTSAKEKRVFDDIKDDKHLEKLMAGVRKQISLARSGGIPQPAATPAPDKYQQLEQLAKLKDQGILSEEEFQSEKTKILSS